MEDFPAKKNRTSKLENLFSEWANVVEDILMKYRERLKKVSKKNLKMDIKMYVGEIRELEKFDEEYRSLTLSNISYPDYSRAIDRLNALCYLARKELESRYSI